MYCKAAIAFFSSFFLFLCNGQPAAAETEESSPYSLAERAEAELSQNGSSYNELAAPPLLEQLEEEEATPPSSPATESALQRSTPRAQEAISWWCGWFGCWKRSRYTAPQFIPASDSWDAPCCTTGGWLPERPPLFRPFIADPRQLTYSLGWRFNDQALTKNVVDVSYFNCLPVYGWCNVLRCGDKMQMDIDGALWAVFDPCSYSAPLLNADYYVGLHLNYAFNRWSWRLRFFHISSHVGDEFLLDHPHFDRRNPSAEYLDLFGSYYVSQDIRLYYGLGYVVNMDDSFHIGRFYTEGGFETRLCGLGCEDSWNCIYAVPFLAIHWRYRNDCNNHADLTYALGYEIGKTNGLCRRLRVYMEYHDGYSVEGQWCHEHTNYLSLRAQYGY